MDFCEDVPALPLADARRIQGLFEAAGAHAKISSIHVNGWFGDYDKLAMTRVFFAEVLGQDLDAVRDAVVFAGDSPNDAPMFAFFPNAVGVANVLDFGDALPARPAGLGHRGPRRGRVRRTGRGPARGPRLTLRLPLLRLRLQARERPSVRVRKNFSVFTP